MGGYGPANAPLVTSGDGVTAGYGTAADPVTFPAGEGLGEARTEKFVKFLDSLKGAGNDTLVESIKEGFRACLESKKWSKKVTEKVKKSEKPKEGTFTKKADAIVSELMDKAEGDAGTSVKKINFYINRAGDKLSNKAEVMKAKALLEKKAEK